MTLVSNAYDISDPLPHAIFGELEFWHDKAGELAAENERLRYLVGESYVYVATRGNHNDFTDRLRAALSPSVDTPHGEGEGQ